ncbi:T9SS type A sorting domain-containing protein [Flavobacterium hauense]
MKSLFLVFFLIAALFDSNAQTVSFDYDSAGNQVARYVCVNCNGRIIKDTITVTEATIDSDEIHQSKIVYYPNPVQEELNIQWMNGINASVSSIEVFSMTGQLLGIYNGLENLQSTAIGFGNYPQGFYNLTMYFTDGKKETIKVVKK